MRRYVHFFLMLVNYILSHLIGWGPQIFLFTSREPQNMNMGTSDLEDKEEIMMPNPA
jgi:hypothetical protein